MTTPTRSLMEQLAEDLRETGLISVTYREKTHHTVARYTDYVGNCAFFGIEGIASPQLVIRQEDWRTEKPNLRIPLKEILTVEVCRHECSNGCKDRQYAWWHAPFGGELQRFAVPVAS